MEIKRSLTALQQGGPPSPLGAMISDEMILSDDGINANRFASNTIMQEAIQRIIQLQKEINTPLNTDQYINAIEAKDFHIASQKIEEQSPNDKEQKQEKQESETGGPASSEQENDTPQKTEETDEKKGQQNTTENIDPNSEKASMR